MWLSTVAKISADTETDNFVFYIGRNQQFFYVAFFGVRDNGMDSKPTVQIVD
jgi:hypothetical protein